MIFILFLSQWALAQSPQDIAQGEYLVRAAECEVCHTERESQPFAGGLSLATPFGTFSTPNISPDSATGIGKWTLAQFRLALRKGVSPTGKIYYPAFPYRSFSKISDSDMEKMYDYLRTVPAIRKSNRPHRLNFPYDQRWLLEFWQFFYFRSPLSDPLENIKVGVGPFVPVANRSAAWNRGAYLVEAVLHCTECHTQRNTLGAPIARLWMGGSEIILSGKRPPNITPDGETGLQWSTEVWRRFLSSGLTPDGSTPGDEMALVVRATSQLTREDRDAVIAYVRALKPVRRTDAEL